MNTENLIKLANYLESLPEDYTDFAMETFIRPRDAAQQVEYALKNGGVHTCGTAACAIGHGPSAGILFPPREKEPEMWREGGYIYPNGIGTEGRYDSFAVFPDWMTYSYAFFIDGDNRSAWEWCFGGNWRHFDDHHWGAAARIRYLLEHGAPPMVDYEDEDDGPTKLQFDDELITEEHVELYASFRKSE